jgi:integrase
LKQVRTADFAAYRDQRLETIKPASLKRDLGTIRHMFEVARHEWGLPIRENPIATLRFKAPDQRRERRLKDGEWERLIQAAKACRNTHIAPIIAVAIETGMRRGEILATRWEHYDTRARTLFIPSSKNGHPRTIPIGATVHKLLEELPKHDRRVFPVSANAFRLAWERAKRRAKIDGLHFHDLRHEAISRFFELGLTTPEVALISGHRDFRMLFRYTHPARELIEQKLR